MKIRYKIATTSILGMIIFFSVLQKNIYPLIGNILWQHNYYSWGVYFYKHSGLEIPKIDLAYLYQNSGMRSKAEDIYSQIPNKNYQVLFNKAHNLFFWAQDTKPGKHQMQLLERALFDIIQALQKEENTKLREAYQTIVALLYKGQQTTDGNTIKQELGFLGEQDNNQTIVEKKDTIYSINFSEYISPLSKTEKEEIEEYIKNIQ